VNPPRNTIEIAKAVLCLLLSLATLPLYAAGYRSDVPMLNMTAGQMGIADDVDDPQSFGIEFRMRSFSRWKLIPAVGYARALNDANFVYSDLRYDYWLNDKWILIPSFGLGTFDDSDEIDLGHKLQFRSGIELAKRFHKDFRIGVALFHLSNAGLSEKNPGTEILVLSLCLPLTK